MITGIETGALVAITAATTAASAGMAYYSAQQQNKTAQRQMDQAAEHERKRKQQSRLQAAIVNKQVTDQAVVQKERLARQAARVRGSMLTSSAELAGQAGAGMSASGLRGNLAASILQEASESRLIAQNLSNYKDKIASGVASGDIESLARLQNAFLQGESMSQNPFLSAAVGGISGLGTGLSISGGVQQMGWLDGAAATGAPQTVPMGSTASAAMGAAGAGPAGVIGSSAAGAIGASQFPG